jgi:hypothetical protein
MTMRRHGITGRWWALVSYGILGLVCFIYNVSSQGTGLVAQFKKAIHMRAEHEAVFIKFSARFSPQVLSKWEQMVLDWDEDNTKPNPYEESRVRKSLVVIECEPRRIVL